MVVADWRFFSCKFAHLHFDIKTSPELCITSRYKYLEIKARMISCLYISGQTQKVFSLQQKQRRFHHSFSTFGGSVCCRRLKTAECVLEKLLSTCRACSVTHSLSRGPPAAEVESPLSGVRAARTTKSLCGRLCNNQLPTLVVNFLHCAHAMQLWDCSQVFLKVVIHC